MSEGEEGVVKVQCSTGTDGVYGLDYTSFSLETVNGEAGPLGSAPKAVHPSSFSEIDPWQYHYFLSYILVIWFKQYFYSYNLVIWY